jgi:hypothetical protein
LATTRNPVSSQVRTMARASGAVAPGITVEVGSNVEHRNAAVRRGGRGRG